MLIARTHKPISENANWNCKNKTWNVARPKRTRASEANPKVNRPGQKKTNNIPNTQREKVFHTVPTIVVTNIDELVDCVLVLSVYFGSKYEIQIELCKWPLRMTLLALPVDTPTAQKQNVTSKKLDVDRVDFCYCFRFDCGLSVWHRFYFLIPSEALFFLMVYHLFTSHGITRQLFWEIRFEYGQLRLTDAMAAQWNFGRIFPILAIFRSFPFHLLESHRRFVV